MRPARLHRDLWLTGTFNVIGGFVQPLTLSALNLGSFNQGRRYVLVEVGIRPSVGGVVSSIVPAHVISEQDATYTPLNPTIIAASGYRTVNAGAPAILDDALIGAHDHNVNQHTVTTSDTGAAGQALITLDTLDAVAGGRGEIVLTADRPVVDLDWVLGRQWGGELLLTPGWTLPDATTWGAPSAWARIRPLLQRELAELADEVHAARDEGC